MPLPDKITVKLSSEAAETASITPVVVQEMALAELVELMLGLAGKDAARIHELLLRGTLVSGASRFRWPGWDAGRADIEELLARFPDPDPARPFDAGHCILVTLAGAGKQIPLPMEVAGRRRLLARRSFWDLLIEVAASEPPAYLDYSYKERADRYRRTLSREAAARLRSEADLLAYSTLAEQVRAWALEAADFYVRRP